MIVWVIGEHPPKAPRPALVRTLHPIHCLIPLSELGVGDDDAVSGTTAAEVFEERIALLRFTEQLIELSSNVAKAGFCKAKLVRFALENFRSLAMAGYT
jgi:hypothetical protein